METIYSYSLKSLEALMEEMGEKKYRAKQIFTWLYRRRVLSFSDMTDIKQGLQQKLAERYWGDPGVTLRSCLIPLSLQCIL